VRTVLNKGSSVQMSYWL